MYDDVFTTADDGTVTLSVHAQPGAGRSAVVGRHGDALKVRVAAPPEGGRANEVLARLLAETLGVPAANVALVSGDKSRNKRFRVTGVDAAELPRILERAIDAGASAPGAARGDNPRARRPR